jgi:hypothetical protein
MFGKSKYPKVLVIDPTPFNRNRNNGIVKSNLFQGWPKERLAQVDYSNMQPGFDVCERYWRLRKLDIVKGVFGVTSLAELPTPQKVTSNIYDPSLAFLYEDRPNIERNLSVLSPQIRMVIGEVILRMPSLLSEPLLHWIDKFSPDIIFSVLSTGPIVRAVVKVSRLRNIPIIPYFTDDWVTTLYENHKLGWFLRHSLKYWFHECITRSPISLTPNNVMRTEYSSRYGGRFVAMHYPEELRQAVKKTALRDEALPVRFIYIGGLTPERWVPLRQIGEALLDLRSEGVNGELLVYTFPADIQKYGLNLTLEPVMRVMGTATPDNVVQLQHEADVLVHVESFHPVYHKWTALSLSTKIPQYLMAGACILAYGPGDVASMRHLSDSNVALTVGKEDPATLRFALMRLIKDEGFRQSLGKKAQEFAVEQHEATRQRELFRSYVVEACNQWPNTRG